MSSTNQSNRIPGRIILENLDAMTNIDGMTKAEVMYDLFKASLIAREGKSPALNGVVSDYNNLLRAGIIQEYSEEEVAEMMEFIESMPELP